MNYFFETLDNTICSFCQSPTEHFINGHTGSTICNKHSPYPVYFHLSGGSNIAFNYNSDITIRMWKDEICIIHTYEFINDLKCKIAPSNSLEDITKIIKKYLKLQAFS